MRVMWCLCVHWGGGEWYKGQGVMASGHRGGVCVLRGVCVCTGVGGRVERMGQVVMASGGRKGVRVFVLCNVCVYTGVGEGYMEGARGGSKWCIYGVCMCVLFYIHKCEKDRGRGDTAKRRPTNREQIVYKYPP